MNPEIWEKVKEIFNEAIGLSPNEREKYLNKTCGNNPEIFNEVNSLLLSYQNQDGFLDNPGKNLPVFSNKFNNDYTGQHIGPYQLINKIDEGGMGVVYLGVRADKEFDKKVAIKLIKQGPRADYIIKKFQNERQALASLDHPYIAKLLDGGTTENGIPYFIMEFVDGIPINNYCDKNNLSISNRLTLFRKVCKAVNFAHKNLVIHRDLKPSNILVTNDGNPKLLDFGIAKILDDKNSPDNTNNTKTEIWNLTPEYASPEQVMGGNITTASDVYSLGVLLYKILTGHHPYRLSNYLPAEITKVICESSPEKPSTIIHTTEELKLSDGTIKIISPEKISSVRSENINKLSKKLSGDLDNIILMAMRKEPERRYSSVEQFSVDIWRHLSGLPVIAQKDTLTYRTSKFIRRHKYGFAASMLIILLFITSIIAISWQAGIAASQRDKAKIEAEKFEKINSFLQQMLNSPDPSVDGKEVKVVDVLNNALKKLDQNMDTAPEIRASIRTSLATTFENLGLYDKAKLQYQKALDTRRMLYGETNFKTAVSIKNLAYVFVLQGDYPKAKQLYYKSINILEKLDSTKSIAYADAQNETGILLTDMGNDNEAITSFNKALPVYKENLGKESQQVASVLNNMAIANDDKGDPTSAEENYKEALKIDLKVMGKDNYELTHIYNNLAFVLVERKKYQEAINYFEKSYKIRKSAVGTNHPDFALATYNLGCTYYYVNNYKKALVLIDTAIRIWKKTLPLDHPLFGNAYFWKGKIYNSLNKPETAISFLKKSLGIRLKKQSNNKPVIARTKCELARSYMLEKKFRSAESLLLKNFKILKKAFGKDNIQVQEVEKILFDLYSKWKKPAEAEKYTTLLADTSNN